MSDILILTASFGMGHKSVSKALKEQIEAENKCADVVIADIWEILNPMVRDFGSKIYCELTENHPHVYNTFYDIKTNYKNNIIDNMFCSLYQKKFHEYLEIEKPRTVISTFPLCSCMLSKIKEEYNFNINLITVITDIVDSWEWIYEGTNIYLVPTGEIKNKLINKGVSSDIILVTGIPVKKGFISETMKLSVKDKNSILIVLSGIDNVSDSVLNKLDKFDNFDIMLVTGRNEKLFEKLSKYMFSNIKVYGYVDNMNQLMDQSLFIVTKPGGVTIFEAINKELPLIVLNSNIGQEKGNIEFIKKNKLGVVIDDFSSLPFILDYYTNNEDMIHYYCENIRRIKKSLGLSSGFGSFLNEVI